jgi:hypothetical protein
MLGDLARLDGIDQRNWPTLVAAAAERDWTPLDARVSLSKENWDNLGKR